EAIFEEHHAFGSREPLRNRPARDRAEAVTVVIDGLMRVVPPPTDIFEGEKLLPGIVAAARLREAISLRRGDVFARSVRVKRYRRPIVRVEPVELLAALDL